MRRILAAALLSLTLAAAGCSGPQAGTIVEKLHRPESTTTVIVPYPQADGTTLCLPQTQTIPEEYAFRVRDGDRVGTVRVSWPIWTHFAEGDYFSF